MKESSERLIVLREEWEYFHQVDQLLGPIAHVESELKQSFRKKINPLKLSEWNHQDLSLFLNLSGLPHLIPLFESQKVIPEQLELISNGILKSWKVELVDRKQLFCHLKMLIGNRFQDENHKEKCADVQWKSC
jgi:hypothetical protein